MALSSSSKKELRDLLIKKVEDKIEKYDFSKTSGNPFVDTLFGKLSPVRSFIHGTATTLGSLYEEFARKIAETNPNFVEVKKIVLEGKISAGEKAVITDLVKDLEEDKNGSDYDAEIKAVYVANDKNLRNTRITIDLYLKTKTGKEFFIEMKGPDPNKKEVRAAKEDLLNVVAIKKRNIKLNDFQSKVGIMFGVYYNNNLGEYDNWKVSPLFESGKGLLVQEVFWDFLGGNGTYVDLLSIIAEAEKVLVPIIKKKLDSL